MIGGGGTLVEGWDAGEGGDGKDEDENRGDGDDKIVDEGVGVRADKTV